MKHYKVEYILKYNNKNESRIERSFKYTLLRLYCNSTNSKRMRDWSYFHISLFLTQKIVK
jgi:hypothetical protein